MCWAFLDTWLEHPEQEALRQVTKEETWEYGPSRPRGAKTKRYVVVKPGSDEVEEEIEMPKGEKIWEYNPVRPAKKSNKESGRKSDKKGEGESVKRKKRKEKGSAGNEKTDNLWEYVTAEPSKAGQKASKASSRKHDVVDPVSSFLPSLFQSLSQASFATITSLHYTTTLNRVT